MNKLSKLKELLTSGNTTIMPDAYDSLSARIIECAGFDAIQCSGYSMCISKCISSELDLSLEQNLEITKSIVDSVSIPVMADGEDGYGDGEEISRTIKEFINVGVAGINIEDQDQRDTKNGLKVINEYQMLEKLITANQAKKLSGKEDFIINARTDSLLALPDRKEALKLAIGRANKYIEAGADLCFVAYTRTLEEIKLLASEINGPISIAAGLQYNCNEFSVKDCIELGIARVSLPTYVLYSSIVSMIENLKVVRDTGEFINIYSKEFDMKGLLKK